MKNISIVTKIQIVALDQANLPNDNGTGEILFDAIPNKANFVTLPITITSGSFVEEKSNTRAGDLFSKQISCRVPKHSLAFEATLKPFLNIPLVAVVSDPNDTEQVVFPLLMTYTKSNPGTPVSYRGYSINFAGSSKNPSIFIKNPEITPEID
jgi:hypothetical protein